MTCEYIRGMVTDRASGYVASKQKAMNGLFICIFTFDPWTILKVKVKVNVHFYCDYVINFCRYGKRDYCHTTGTSVSICGFFRFTLTFDFVNSKGRGPGHAHFDCEYLLNGERFEIVTIAISKASNICYRMLFFVQSLTFDLISFFFLRIYYQIAQCHRAIFLDSLGLRHGVALVTVCCAEVKLCDTFRYYTTDVSRSVCVCVCVYVRAPARVRACVPACVCVVVCYNPTIKHCSKSLCCFPGSMLRRKHQRPLKPSSSTRFQHRRRRRQ